MTPEKRNEIERLLMNSRNSRQNWHDLRDAAPDLARLALDQAAENAKLLNALQVALPHLEENARFLRDTQASAGKVSLAFAVVDIASAALEPTTPPDVAQAARVLLDDEAKIDAVYALVRKYIATVGDAEGIDFIEEGPHLTKEDCAALRAIAGGDA